MKNQIFWLVSYPKSGNTLLRSILISLFFSKDGKFKLDEAYKINQFETTNNIKKNFDLLKRDFNKLNNLPILYNYLNKLQSKESLRFDQDFIFLKTHAGLYEVGGNPFTYELNTRGIIYIIRDPRDVCISWAKHTGMSINQSIDFMLNEFSCIFWMEPKNNNALFEENRRPKILLSSWDKHLLSWTTIKWNRPALVLKFEDLVYDKEKQIYKLINFFEVNYGFKFANLEEKIKNIIENTKFEKFKRYEKDKGFLEATANSSFFSVGKKNQWKNRLDKKQIKKIEGKFGKLMKKFDYKIDVEI